MVDNVKGFQRGRIPEDELETIQGYFGGKMAVYALVLRI